MRISSSKRVFQGILLTVTTTGGYTCNAPVCPPSLTEELTPYGGSFVDAGPEAGYVVDDAGVVQLTGDMAAPLPDAYCASVCQQTSGYRVGLCALERLAKAPPAELVERGLVPGRVEAGELARRLAAALPV